MTPSVYAFVQRLRDEGKLDGHLLDVGARDVNGCVRDLFPTGQYVGLDKQAGPNVDHIWDIERDSVTWPFHVGLEWDHILCLEAIEHMPQFLLAVTKMKALLEPGRRLVLTTRGIGYPLHDEPEDYYRFTEHAMRYLLRDLADVEVVVAEEGRGIYGTGVKR